MDFLQAAELTIVRVIIHVLRQIAPAHLSQMHARDAPTLLLELSVNRIVLHITVDTLGMETLLQTAVLIAIVFLIVMRQYQH
tara:strand:+ start:11 stop:256 length:246 start_codon:yes stop_codon:yes gene_type:complete